MIPRQKSFNLSVRHSQLAKTATKEGWRRGGTIDYLTEAGLAINMRSSVDSSFSGWVLPEQLAYLLPELGPDPVADPVCATRVMGLEAPKNVILESHSWNMLTPTAYALLQIDTYCGGMEGNRVIAYLDFETDDDEEL